MYAPLRAGLNVAVLLVSTATGNAQTTPGFTVLQRVDVLMDYSWKMPKGSAAVRWTTLHETHGLSESYTKIALAGFLYARTIVNHAETRRTLINRTEPAAVGLVKGAESFEMEPFSLEAGGMSFPVYPWKNVTPEMARDARTYTAYLVERPDGTIGGHLTMASGYERILAPAAPLIVFQRLAGELSGPERVLLGRVIHSINDFYSRKNLADTASLLGSDFLVTTVVVSVLKEEQSFAGGERERPTISRAELLKLSQQLAEKMGNMFARQRACGLNSNFSPDRTAGFFVNFMSEADVQSVMDSYANGLEIAAGRSCDRKAVAQGLGTMMTETRAYMRVARPFQNEWR